MSSVKWPTIGRSCDATPRSSGASSAARARRLAGASGSNFLSLLPNGSFFECALMYFSAVRIIHSEFFAHCALVSPHAVMPWPPRMQPTACGLASLMAAMSRPSWKPGRRHGTHTTFSPYTSLVSVSPSAAVAIAIPESGWRWST